MSKARQLADLGNVYDDGALSNRNMIINGAMQVAQRGTSVSGLTAGAYGAADRWELGTNLQGTWTFSQETDAPDGFSNSSKVLCTTANASPDANGYITFRQRIEAQNLQHLKYGTSSAVDLTASFWVKSNVTGTYTLSVENEDNPNNNGRTYTINAADTWEYKTLVFSGDTSGGINNDNGTGIEFQFWLGSGSSRTSGTFTENNWTTTNANRVSSSQVNLASATSNYWQITGVQLEVGDTATPFEHRSYGDELARCQRYYYDTTHSISIYVTANGYYGVPVTHPVEMRASPSGTISGGTIGSGTTGSVPYRNEKSFRFTLQATGTGGVYYDNAFITMDAEL